MSTTAFPVVLIILFFFFFFTNVSFILLQRIYFLGKTRNKTENTTGNAISRIVMTVMITTAGNMGNVDIHVD